MKVLVVILLIVAAVYARSTGLQKAATASPGENPSVVHIRLAVRTSGYLKSCVGSLISDRWILTSKQCLQDSTFYWFRYGVVEVIKPEFVTERGTVITHPAADLALINTDRVIESTDKIAPIALASGSEELAESGKVCGFGETENGGPGEWLKCVNVSIKEEGGLIETESEEGQATKYDIGAALVVDGKQVGVLVDWKNGDGASFVKVADYLDWIESTTNLKF